MTKEEILAMSQEVTSHSITVNGREEAVELLCHSDVITDAEARLLAEHMERGVDAILARRQHIRRGVRP